MRRTQLTTAAILTGLTLLLGLGLTLTLGKVALALYAPAIPVPLVLLWLSIVRVESDKPVPDTSLRFST